MVLQEDEQEAAGDEPGLEVPGDGHGDDESQDRPTDDNDVVREGLKNPANYPLFVDKRLTPHPLFPLWRR